MTLKEYQQQTKRTLPDLGSYQLNIDHMIFGMNSEFDELYDAILSQDKIGISEEGIDVGWYLSNYCNLTGIEINNEFNFRDTYYCEYEDEEEMEYDYFVNLFYQISKLTNLEKRELAYKKKVENDKRLLIVINIYKRLNDLFLSFDINPYEAMEKNINKLKIRYPEKFTEELALNRNLEEERKTLEN